MPWTYHHLRRKQDKVVRRRVGAVWTGRVQLPRPANATTPELQEMGKAVAFQLGHWLLRHCSEASKVKAGLSVQVWYAQGEELQDATVVKVTKMGTVEVSYVDLELEEEVPLLYLFEPAKPGDKSNRSSIASSSVAPESVDLDGSRRLSEALSVSAIQDKSTAKKKFANGDLVEVYVGEDEDMAEKDWEGEAKEVGIRYRSKLKPDLGFCISHVYFA